MNNSNEYIAYYDSKIEKYKNRIKWLCKIIRHLNDKIDIYEECKSDFTKVPLPTLQYISVFGPRKKQTTKANNVVDIKADNKENNTTDE